MNAAWYEKQGPARDVLVVGEMPDPDPVPAGEVVGRIRALAPEGVGHIVEVAFDANIAVDTEVLAAGGSLAAYATGEPWPPVPFWQLLFKNVRVFFLGSDDFPAEAKAAAARELNAALSAGWLGFDVGRRFPLSGIAEAHEYLEERRGSGRVVVTTSGDDDRLAAM